MNISKRALDRKLIVLGAAFLALALFYSLIIPIFEGPDEDAHFRYAKFIADHHALPVQQFQTDGGEAGHQGWQPPLYYSLAAVLIAPLDTADFPQHLWRNEAATFVGDPSCCGRNIYYHTDSENFPFTGTTLAVHWLRLLSIFCGLVTVLATYGIVQALFPDDSWPALAAAAFVAFNPSFLFASALVSNDAALAALSALVLLIWMRVLQGRTPLSPRTGALLGLLLGLAILVKTTAIGLVPFTLIVIALAAWRHSTRALSEQRVASHCEGSSIEVQRTHPKQSHVSTCTQLESADSQRMLTGSYRSVWRQALASAIVVLVLVAVISGWWFVRNQILYGDPLALQLMQVSALFPRSGPLTLQELFQISLPWLWRTFWGGPTPGDFSPLLLAALAFISALAVLGLIAFALRASKSKPQDLRYRLRIPLLVLGCWLAFILVAQIQFIRTTVGADQGRYLFPAISAIALLFVLGLSEFLRLLASLLTSHASPTTPHASPTTPPTSRLTLPQSSLVSSPDPTYLAGLPYLSFVICSFVIAVFVPFAYTLPAYARPALLTEGDLSRVSRPLQVNLANQIELRGYDLATRVVKPGDTLSLTLYWRALAAMPASYRVFVHLVALNDRVGGGADLVPARGAFPTVYWKPGDTLRDVAQIPVSADAVPGKYTIEVGLYPVGHPSDRLTVAGSDEDRVLLDTLKIAPRQPLAYTPTSRVDADFGGKARLLGYDAERDGRSLDLTLYWQDVASMDRDYTVFVHLLRPDGTRVSQADQMPQAGNYPTSLWEPGEQVRDDYVLPLASGDATTYRVELGLYRHDTGERLPVRTKSGESDHVEFDWSAGQ